MSIKKPNGVKVTVIGWFRHEWQEWVVYMPESLSHSVEVAPWNQLTADHGLDELANALRDVKEWTR